MTVGRKSISWESLAPTERFRIALSVARRRGVELSRRYDNVLTVGAGFRSRRLQRHTDEVCLSFLVNRKTTRLGSEQRIPATVLTYIRRRGKRVALRIPTDVSERRSGRPHADLKEGIMTRGDGGPIEYGAIACLLRNAKAAGERYLLTCFHVVSPAMAAPLGSIACVNSGTGARVGVFSANASPSAPGLPVDAALIAADDGVAPLNVWERAIVSKATDSDLHELGSDPNLFILARRNVPASGAGGSVPPRQGPLSASFQRIWTSRDFYYPDANRTFAYADTLEYRAQVRPGDSGSAVIDGDGKLLGMHFYGDAQYGYALSAPRLFDPAVFGVDVWLSDAHG